MPIFMLAAALAGLQASRIEGTRRAKSLIAQNRVGEAISSTEKRFASKLIFEDLPSLKAVSPLGQGLAGSVAPSFDTSLPKRPRPQRDRRSTDVTGGLSSIPSLYRPTLFTI